MESVDVRSVWQGLKPHMSTWRRALRLSSFIFGVTPWLRLNRLERLERLSMADYLRTAIPTLGSRELAALEARARVNREIASSAFRYTIFSNVTLPIATIAIVNEVSNGQVYSVALDLFGTHSAVVSAVAAGVLVSGAFALVAYAAAINARDAHFLIQIYAPTAGANDPGDDTDVPIGIDL